MRFVWRHYPFIGSESFAAAEAAECAGDQGAFWRYHDTLFAEQRQANQGTFSRENLKRYAAELGLDTDSFAACLDSDATAPRVAADQMEGRSLGVDRTPTLFINGALYTGQFQIEDLLDQLASAAGR